jgi:hypothetical protein
LPSELPRHAFAGLLSHLACHVKSHGIFLSRYYNSPAYCV